MSLPKQKLAKSRGRTRQSEYEFQKRRKLSGLLDASLNMARKFHDDFYQYRLDKKKGEKAGDQEVTTTTAKTVDATTEKKQLRNKSPKNKKRKNNLQRKK